MEHPIKVDDLGVSLYFRKPPFIRLDHLFIKKLMAKWRVVEGTSLGSSSAIRETSRSSWRTFPLRNWLVTGDT